MRTEAEIRREIERALSASSPSSVCVLYTEALERAYIAALEWVLSAPANAPVGGTNAGTARQAIAAK